MNHIIIYYLHFSLTELIEIKAMFIDFSKDIELKSFVKLYVYWSNTSQFIFFVWNVHNYKQKCIVVWMDFLHSLFPESFLYNEWRAKT